MAKLVESSGRPAKQSASAHPTKMCLKCGKVKDVSDFFANKDWVDQLGHDVWCKECAQKCSSKDEMREYFWENHRQWNERIWELAKNKALKLASNNLAFQKAADDRRKSILEKLTCQQVPTMMTLPSMYKYFDPEKDGKAISFEEAKAVGLVEEPEDEEEKAYNEEFNGYFKPRELNYLKAYYAELEKDYTLDTQNIRDYARKICRASLMVDKAYDDYAAGRCDFSVVKDAINVFDTLSKSANFAACKRKPGDNGGISSWSELTLKLETSGYPCTRKIEWEPDDVDKTIEEYRHIVDALGLGDS